MLATLPRVQTIFNRPATSHSPISGPSSASTTSPTARSPQKRVMEYEFGGVWGAEKPKARAPVHSQFSASDAAALQAAMFGYGGHGAAFAQGAGQALPMKFWDETAIEEVVTMDFIKSQFSERGALRERLESAIDSGGDLTEATYLEWIHEKMRRFFLIMVDIGCKEKIFDLVDGSWDDSDLPLSAPTIARLDLGASTEKRFYKKQYDVLVKCLEQGDYVEYFEDEIVPVEALEKKPSQTNAGMTVDKVVCRKHKSMMIRVRMPLPKVAVKRESEDSMGSIVDKTSMVEDAAAKKAFLDELDFRRSLNHPHIQSVFAAYTHQEYGYMLFTPMTELTLKQFIQTPPLSYKTMDKKYRRNTIIKWLFCMVSALNYLHANGVPHYRVSPRTVMITSDHEIVLVDIHLNSTPRQASPSADIEAYDYGAPEQWVRALASHESSFASLPSSTNGARSHKLESAGSSTASTSPPSYVSSWTQAGMSVQTAHKPSIFSLGAIFLDLLTFALKRKPSAFSSHRSAKNQRPRVSGRPDASFHGNIPQVKSWIDLLEKDAKKKTWCAAREALATVRYMLVRDPMERIAGQEAERQIRRIVELESIPICKCAGGSQPITPASSTRPPFDRRETLRSVKSSATMNSSTTGSTSLMLTAWEVESFEKAQAVEKAGWLENNLSNRFSKGTTLSSSSRSSRVGWAI